MGVFVAFAPSCFSLYPASSMPLTSSPCLVGMPCRMQSLSVVFPVWLVWLFVKKGCWVEMVSDSRVRFILARSLTTRPKPGQRDLFSLMESDGRGSVWTGARVPIRLKPKPRRLRQEGKDPTACPAADKGFLGSKCPKVPPEEKS